MHKTEGWYKMLAESVQQRHVYDLARMLIEHYEFPLYHTIYHERVRSALLRWAVKDVGLDYLVQGYIDRALQKLKQEGGVQHGKEGIKLDDIAKEAIKALHNPQ